MPNSQTVWVQASELVSRTLAVVLLMLIPGAVGNWLDGWLGTAFLMPLGFVFGVIGGTTALVIISKQFNSPRRENEGDPPEGSG